MSESLAKEKKSIRLSTSGLKLKASDWASAWLMLSGVILLWLHYPALLAEAIQLIHNCWSPSAVEGVQPSVLLLTAIKGLFKVSVSWFGLFWLMAFLIHVSISGCRCHWSRLIPKLSNLSVGSYFSNTFSRYGLFKVVKILCTYGLLLIVVFLLVRFLFLYDHAHEWNQEATFKQLAKISVLISSALLGVVFIHGLIDYAIELYRLRKIRMVSLSEIRAATKENSPPSDVRFAIKRKQYSTYKSRLNK